MGLRGLSVLAPMGLRGLSVFSQMGLRGLSLRAGRYTPVEIAGYNVQRTDYWVLLMSL